MERLNVFYYNQWRGVDLPELRECFSQLSTDEVANLKQGDEVWIDGEPYHLNGKVYGYTRVAFSGQVDSDHPPQLFKCVDPQKLEALVQEHKGLVLSPVSQGERDAFERFRQDWKSVGLPE